MTEPFDDDALAAALRRRAEQLAPDVPTDRALTDVRRRARRRMVGRTVMAGAIAASALAVLAGGVVLIGDDDPVVRTPATAPAPPVASPETSTPPPASTPAPATPTTAATRPTTAAATPTTAPVTATVAPTVPVVAPDTAPTTYRGAGGSVTVVVANGRVGLVGDPAPSPGYTARIDDDGPTRVRVRFEDGEHRTEIRVDLEGGVLVPRVDEN